MASWQELRSSQMHMEWLRLSDGWLYNAWRGREHMEALGIAEQWLA
jgi:hypothetical protein